MFKFGKKTTLPTLKLRIAAFAAYILMVLMNALATLLPINGSTSGEISDSYPNLFAPSGMTFAIWGVIYIALGIFSVWLLVDYGKKSKTKLNAKVLEGCTRLFIYSSLLNAIWILCWHYRLIGVALVVIAAMLTVTGKICLRLHYEKLTNKEYALIKLPFVIYFGWLTVATLANFVTFLVSVGMDGTTGTGVVVAIGALLIGGAAGAYVTIRYSDVVYAGVLLWAYYGIISKHLSDSGWDGAYPAVIIVTCAMFGLLVAAVGLVCYDRLTARR